MTPIILLLVPLAALLWLLLMRGQSPVQTGGRRRLRHPYPGASVRGGHSACALAQSLEGKRFLATEVPDLPLEGCTAPNCTCRYQCYSDRRQNLGDRRLLAAGNDNPEHGERRVGSERRRANWKIGEWETQEWSSAARASRQGQPRQAR